MNRKIFSITKLSRNGGPKGSNVLTVPAEICRLRHLKQGDRFLISIDDTGCLIYEHLKNETECEGDKHVSRHDSPDTQITQTSKEELQSHILNLKQ